MNVIKFMGVIFLMVVSGEIHAGRIFKKVSLWKEPYQQAHRLYMRSNWLRKAIKKETISKEKAVKSFRSIVKEAMDHRLQLGNREKDLFKNVRKLSKKLHVLLPLAIGGGYVPCRENSYESFSPSSSDDDNSSSDESDSESSNTDRSSSPSSSSSESEDL